MLFALCSMLILIMKKPQPIHSILEKTFKALEIDVPLKSYSIWGAWKEIVGESVALYRCLSPDLDATTPISKTYTFRKDK
ncbi:MAG: hypothetical protein ABSH06_30335 [Thermodesulfobacteriota bacterium]